MKLDLTSIFGLVVAIGGIGTGFLLEGGHPSALLAVSPLCIIFGGTIGATVITQPFDNVLKIPAVLKTVFQQKQYDYVQLIHDISNWSKKVRTEGIPQLETIKDQIEDIDPFLSRGLQMVANTTEPKNVEEILQSEIDAMTDRHFSFASIFESGGGFSPTMGIIGTVLGLITVLSKLGGSNIAALGDGIASAFLATFMGISLANLILLPFNNKLRNKNSKEVLYREIILKGLLSIQKQEPYFLIESRLFALLPEYMKKKKGEKTNG